MKRFALYVLVLLVAFAGVNLLYILLMRNIDWEFQKTREAHNFKGQQFRMLVLGNSTAMDGINTAMLSKAFGPSYNLSVGGATLKTNYLQLKYYLENNEAPQKILLALSSSHIRYKPMEEIHPAVEYYYYPYDCSNIQQLPLFKFRWLFTESIKRYTSAAHRSAALVDGQLQINRVVKDATTFAGASSSCLLPADYATPAYDYLWKMIDLCVQHKIEVLIVEMPCWKNQQNDCPQLTLSDKAGNSFTLLNFNNRKFCDTMLNPGRDWLSKNHLNLSGSVQLTGEIIRQLKSSLQTVNANAAE